MSQRLVIFILLSFGTLEIATEAFAPPRDVMTPCELTKLVLAGQEEARLESTRVYLLTKGSLQAVQIPHELNRMNMVLRDTPLDLTLDWPNASENYRLVVDKQMSQVFLLDPANPQRGVKLEILMRREAEAIIEAVRLPGHDYDPPEFATQVCTILYSRT